MKIKPLISTLELKRLCIELKERNATVCIRLRMMGQMWQKSFCKVADVSETDTVTLHNETDDTLLSFAFSEVMQFELDGKYQQYQPFFHYDVSPFI